MPSFGPRVNSVSPWPRSASPAGCVVPPGPSTRPMPASGPNACASCVISPAVPAPWRGTAGTMPWLRKSASRWQSAADTPASPDRNVSSRAAKIARTSGGLSHGGPPAARASSRLRWCERCCSSVRRTEDSAPMPVLTPYTGCPSRRARLACSQRSCTAASSSSPMATGAPAATALIRPGSAVPASAITARASLAVPEHRPGVPLLPPGAGWPGPRRYRGWPARGATAGSARRHAPGPAAAR